MTHLVLDTAGLHLVSEDLGTVLLSLGFVNVLHKHTLVLEDVTLRLLVENMVPSQPKSVPHPPWHTIPALTNAYQSCQPPYTSSTTA